MKLMNACLYGILASIAAAETGGFSVKNDPDALYERDTHYAKRTCNDQTASHVHFIRDGTLVESIDCVNDFEKRSSSASFHEPVGARLDQFPGNYIVPRSKSVKYVQDSHASNATTHHLASREVKKYEIKLRWGGFLHHVGTITAQDLFDELSKIFNDAMPNNGGGHNAPEKLPWKRVPSDPKRNVGYEKGGTWHGDGGWLKVTPTMAYFPLDFPSKGHGKDMRYLLTRMAASMYYAMVKQDFNCTVRDFKNQKNVRFCQVPEWVSIEIEHRAWMVVSLQFDGDTKEKYAKVVLPDSEIKNIFGSYREDLKRDSGGKDFSISHSFWGWDGKKMWQLPNEHS